MSYSFLTSHTMYHGISFHTPRSTILNMMNLVLQKLRSTVNLRKLIAHLMVALKCTIFGPSVPLVFFSVSPMSIILMPR